MTRTSAYAMLGSSLLFLILNLAIIAPMATSAVQDFIDTNTVLNEDSWSDDSWLNASDERSYYAWSITNIDDVATNGSDPIFERVGPYKFQINMTRNLVSHDVENGTYTYNESSVFTSIGENQPTDLVSNINILYEAQKIVVFPTMIEQLQQISQASFVVSMLEYDLANTHASTRIGDEIQSDIDDSSLSAADASADWGNATLELWSQANNYTGTNANFTTLSIALWGDSSLETVSPELALCGKYGADYFLNIGQPSPTTSAQRAQFYGYADADANITEARDAALHAYVDGEWLNYGGGIEWTSASDEELQERFSAVMGTSFAGKNIRSLLNHNDSTSTPDGLLAWDDNDLIPGFANFFSLSDNPAALGAWAFLNFGISITEIEQIGEYAGSWMDGSYAFPLALTGGEGDITSLEFPAITWGGVNPISGGYDMTSVNGPGSEMPWLGYSNVQFDDATVERILNGPNGITTPESINVLYGIYSGKTVPVTADMTPTIGGDQIPWTNETLASIYNITTTEADTLEFWIKGMFDSVLPQFLEGIFGVTKYTTMEVNQWLFGWHDPLLAYSASNETSISAAMADQDVGWASLETNLTYYGSPNVTNDPSTHTRKTGGNDLSEVGEYVNNNGDSQLWWRTSAHYNGTYGLTPIIDAAGTTGGWVDGTNYDSANPPSFTVNLADYAIVEAEYVGKGDLHGITTEVWHANADPLNNPVQAKNIDSETIMDVFPGVLPIYFGSNTTLMSESVTGRIVSGDSQSVIYFDQRGLGAQNPTMDELQAVFMIESSSSMDAETAQLVQDKVHANQDPMTYWTNFDTDASGFYIDQVTATFYALAILLGAIGGWRWVNSTAEFDEVPIDSTSGNKEWKDDVESVDKEIEDAVDSTLGEEE